jgi:anion-transporting  ArsA/GET3 family ATPase
MHSIFGMDAIGHAPIDVGDGVRAMNIELRAAISDYVLRYVKVRSVADRVAKNAALARFFEAAPGVAETVTLAKIEALVAGRRGESTAGDPVIVDLDSSGHALMLLELPRVLEGLLGAGALRRMIRGATALLRDPETTALHVVTLPAALVVQETLELWTHLRSEHSVPLGAVFVNRVPEVALSEGSAKLIPALTRKAAEHGLHDLLRAVRVAESRLACRSLAMTEIDRLRRAAGTEPLLLPRLDTWSEPSDVVRALSLRLDSVEAGADA